MGLELQPDICSVLIKDVIHHEEAVRQAGAEALSKGVEEYRSQTRDVMTKLMELYQEKLYVSHNGGATETLGDIQVLTGAPRVEI